jgi:hypothetical protein
MERGVTRLSKERLSNIAEIYQVAPFDLVHKTADELLRQIMDNKSSPPPRNRGERVRRWGT